MEDQELERRLDIIENSFIRFEGKVDLINHQLESREAATVERVGNISAAIALNRDSLNGHIRWHERELAPRIRHLEDWRTTMKAYGRGTVALASFLSATLSSVATWAIIEAITRQH